MRNMEMMIKMKIGMYTEDEIFEYMNGGNGVRFLGRSMYDAIFDKIHALITENEQLQNNWNELKKFVDEELDRLARECSQIYEDSLGKTRLVNEDIYNEVKNISNKMQELGGENNE